jgi:DNA-binding CsgD family transcriptional regulator
LAPGEILLFDYQHEDERSIDRSEYYEWLQEKGQGIRYYLGGRMITADGSDGFLSLAFRKREGHATETQMRLFGLLMPHVSRAIRIGQRLATWNLKREISLAALEALGCGLILLSSRSQVVFSNPAAHRILSAQDGLTLRADGLRAADSDVNERLVALQRRLMRGPIVHGSQRIRVPKISGGLEYVVEVFRLGRDVEVVHEARPVVAIFISDASRSSGIDAASFRSHYGLSPAEIELAADLATGLPVAQIAVNHRQSIHTVRSQLKGILRKTQAHRQAELARLLSHVSFQPQTTRESR